MTIVACDQCGMEMNRRPSIVGRHNYCSQECVGLARRGPGNFTCTECGASISRRSGKCRSCAAIVSQGRRKGIPSGKKLPRVEVPCEICGTIKAVTPGRAPYVRTCSKACMYELKRRTTAGVNSPHWKPRDPTICENCGDPFMAKANMQGISRFCSLPCVGAYTIRHIAGQPTSIEIAIAEELTNRGIAFQPQVPIGGFIADFLIGDSVVVEADGDYWHSLPKAIARDARKNAALNKRGLLVIRIPEHEIKVGNFSRLDQLGSVA